MFADRTAAASPKLAKGWRRPMTEEDLVWPADDDVSPYLRRPLRTLEEAEQDNEDRQRKTTADGIKNLG